MGVEIERKFLVDTYFDQGQEDGVRIKQGYLGPADIDQPCTRIRICEGLTDEAFLTIKSRHLGAWRMEFEYAIPVEDARELLLICKGGTVEKRRCKVQVGDHIWEIDVFEGRHAGLLMAEIELDHADETFEMPDWVTKEVTDDPRYNNLSLATYGFPV